MCFTGEAFFFKTKITMNLKPKIVKKLYLSCPRCDYPAHRVDHIIDEPKTYGPWHCNECGLAIKFNVNRSKRIDTIITIEEDGPWLSLLKLNIDSQTPIFIITKTNFKMGEYWVNEGTCPSNILRMPILCGTDFDPHGIFELLETVPCPDDWSWNGFRDTNEHRYEDVFSKLKEYLTVERIKNS